MNESLIHLTQNVQKHESFTNKTQRTSPRSCDVSVASFIIIKDPGSNGHSVNVNVQCRLL